MLALHSLIYLYFRLRDELAKGSAPKQIVDDLPRNSTDYVRVVGCSIPEGTLFAGGDTHFLESLGFSGSLSGAVNEDVIRNRLEVEQLSGAFKELQMNACRAMYEDDPAILNEWKAWTKLEMQQASRKADEGFIVWIKPRVDCVPIPQKIFPPAPVITTDGSKLAKNHPAVKAHKAASRVLGLLRLDKRVDRAGEFSLGCFHERMRSCLYDEEISYCEFLESGDDDGMTAYRARK